MFSTFLLQLIFPVSLQDKRTLYNDQLNKMSELTSRVFIEDVETIKQLVLSVFFFLTIFRVELFSFIKL